ncbi:MAG: hypothetical protein J6Y33_03020 [Prevotella sp.]|nr:hypothetical protein [Prevotella sp.]
MKKKLECIAEDEALQDEFIINLSEQVATDDEVPRKKFRALKEAYEKDPALVDEVLMAICGWRMETLVDNAIAVCDE